MLYFIGGSPPHLLPLSSIMGCAPVFAIVIVIPIHPIEKIAITVAIANAITQMWMDPNVTHTSYKLVLNCL